jgi:hypothetical protein
MYVADDLIHGEHAQAFSGRDIDLDPTFDVRSPTLWLFLSAFRYLSPASLEPAEITEVDFYLCLIF